MTQAFTDNLQGLRVGVVSMRGDDPMHQAALGKALQDAIAREAKAHDAAFETARFKNILKAAQEGKIQALFLVAAWENCLPKIVGAAVDFPTVLTKWDEGKKDFNHFEATYREDTCLLRDVMREVVKERPAGMPFPRNLGLGAYFEQECLRCMIADGHAGRMGEVSSHSMAMMSVLDKFGMRLEQDNAVLEVKTLSPCMKRRWRMETQTEGLSDPATGQMRDNVFVTSWSGPNGEKIAASFSRGISTFTGDPVARVQITSNQKGLPEQEALKDVLSSLLIEGHDEMEKRGWKPQQTAQRARRSPIIPLTAPRAEALRALMAHGSDEILIPQASGGYGAGGVHGVAHIIPLFGESSAPVMRIHVMNEPEITGTLRALGVQTRMLGPHAMVPAMMDFAKMDLSGLAGAKAFTPPRPLKTLNLSPETGKPLFSLAA